MVRWNVLLRHAPSMRGSHWTRDWVKQGYCREYFANRATVGRCTRPTWMIRSPFASRKSAVVLANPAVPARNPASASFFWTMVVFVVTSAVAALTRFGAATAYVLARSARPEMSAWIVGILGLSCLK